MNEAEHYGQNEQAETFRERISRATERVEWLETVERQRERLGTAATENSRGLTYPDLTTQPSAGLPRQSRPEGIPAEKIPEVRENWTRQSSWLSRETMAAARQLADALRELERAQALVTQARTLLENLLGGTAGADDPYSEERLREEAARVVRAKGPTTREPDPVSHTEARSGMDEPSVRG